MDEAGGARLALVDASADRKWMEKVEEAAKDGKKLYVHECGGWHGSNADSRTVAWIAACFATIANQQPRAELVPLLSEAGWCVEKISGRNDLVEVCEFEGDEEHVRETSSKLKKIRQQRGQPALRIVPMPSVSKGEADPGTRILDYDVSNAEGCSFDYVAVGGTFDRMHAGHRVLLAVAAVCCTTELYVGITSDGLLANKEDKDMIRPYDSREATVREYLKNVNPSLVVTTGALSDPKEPTAASLVESMQALVVSEETVVGGHAINEDRKRRGFSPLKLIVIKLLFGKTREKLSSTALRQEDKSATRSVGQTS
mmetsp:Transcript_4597/g.29153  ORF Transcript_4597/g.29153 Transcript_4597/m.29153 type:complete len:313 (-) Transcript_4597:1517-2455(-)|eukprot:CAMPEP_0183827088 /NCGR_PEP_ID=MMETSP0807_2-20130328/2048_1 /TAXON_ID=88271 /ORGANISM="Picocystis salinarum, Strain CCMP1897" /LENGTH=312 /DNA_ID=CAMNT_0026072225 /DNA_START=157 /DNA_END=1095 /DNA_ORIENTATION=-